jgi:hypothetical protein
MTSKAAKKAYQKSNGKGSRMTAKERRDADAAELDRQKKEFDKEKTAARAKAAREKKAEKTAKEKETRRKMGLPEPSKHVRASQPTISRFVRSGSKRTWHDLDEITEDSDGTLDDLLGGMGQPPAKRAADNNSDDEFGEFPLSSPEMLERLDSPPVSIKEEKVVSNPTSTKKHKVSAPKLRKSSPLKPALPDKNHSVLGSSEQRAVPPPLKKELSDSEFGDFPSLSQCDILERLASSATPPIQGSAATPQAHSAKNRLPNKVQVEKKSKSVSAVTSSKELPVDNSQELADMAATQLLSEAADAVFKSARTDSTPKSQPLKLSSRLSAGSSIHNAATAKNVVTTQERHMPTKAAKSDRPALTERPVNMPPPPIPSKTTKSISFAASPDKSRPAPRSVVRSFPRTPLNMPPSATQAFLEEHIDDFFPSPSQQIRELLEDVDDMPSNTQVAREISPLKPARDDALRDLFSTQDVNLSAEDIVEITTPSRAPKGLAEPPPAPASMPGHPTKHESTKDVPREKRRFFEEKDEDLLQAAIHESKMLAAAQKAQKATPIKEPPMRTRGALQRALSEASDYGFDDDFSGCSQELLALP